MFFCPNCNNIYDITKTVPNLNLDQTGGKMSETPNTVSSLTKTTSTSDAIPAFDLDVVINRILSGDNIDPSMLKGVTSDILLQYPGYKKLQNKFKEIVHNKISDLIPGFNIKQTVSPISTNAYFICTNCGNFEQMKSNTLIARKVYNETSSDYEDQSKFKDLANVKYLPITRNYICRNQNCVSHNDHTKRAARFYRLPSSFKTAYICIACETSWI